MRERDSETAAGMLAPTRIEAADEALRQPMSHHQSINMLQSLSLRLSGVYGIAPLSCVESGILLVRCPGFSSIFSRCRCGCQWFAPVPWL